MSGRPMGQSTDYLDRFADELPVDAIRTRRRDADARTAEERWAPFLEAVAHLPEISASRCQFDESVVTIGAAGDLDSEEAKRSLLEALDVFRPWKKGPWSIFGEEIDAEWRSDQKWDRWQGHYTSLRGRRVADVGCHNGYFMYRMVPESPDLVVGFEPVPRHRLAFELLQKYACREELAFETFGVDALADYPRFFDTVFCFGLLYHLADPIEGLRVLHRSLVPGGELLIDCQGIPTLPGEAGNVLFPSGRYARARGVWFLPNREALASWLRRTGFRDLEWVYEKPLDANEQRSTEWADIGSLEESLNAEDPTRTVEGYPAPWRYYVRAIRG